MKSKSIMLMAIAIVVLLAAVAVAGKTYTLLSGVSLTAATGSAVSVDGQFKTWAVQASCTGELASAPTNTTIQGNIGGATYTNLTVFDWTSDETSAGQALRFFDTKPVSKIRATMTQPLWNTTGTCTVKALGVN